MVRVAWLFLFSKFIELMDTVRVYEMCELEVGEKGVRGPDPETPFPTLLR